MKIRNGFVSNSSSSSFICDVCGEEITGMGISFEDYNLCECEEGHIFHKEEAVNREKPCTVISDFNKQEYTYEDFFHCYEEDSYDIPSFYCPICQFKKVSYMDALSYLLKKSGYGTLEDVKEEILSSYSSNKELQEFIKDTKKYFVYTNSGC